MAVSFKLEGHESAFLYLLLDFLIVQTKLIAILVNWLYFLQKPKKPIVDDKVMEVRSLSSSFALSCSQQLDRVPSNLPV